jgi:hypothetical protein
VGHAGFVTAYDVAPWQGLFTATAGACAALAGLVFVAVSINIKAILALKGVPERGLHTVLLLLAAVVVSVFGLVPQGIGVFGVELIVVGVVLLGWLGRTLGAVMEGTAGQPAWVASRVIVVIPGSVPYVVGGVSLLAGAGGGLFWVLTGVIGGIVGGVINAWVLLVEILR